MSNIAKLIIESIFEDAKQTLRVKTDAGQDIVVRDFAIRHAPAGQGNVACAVLTLGRESFDIGTETQNPPPNYIGNEQGGHRVQAFNVHEPLDAWIVVLIRDLRHGAATMIRLSDGRDLIACHIEIRLVDLKWELEIWLHPDSYDLNFRHWKKKGTLPA
jgi:hypothetical protein